MAKNENKTKPNILNVDEYLDTITDDLKKSDSLKLVEIMKSVSGLEPVMWGASIVGFGTYHYKYASGREGDWFLIGFSPRKNNFSIYVKSYVENYEEELLKIGKHKTGKGCIYVKKLSDIDIEVLKDILRKSLE